MMDFKNTVRYLMEYKDMQTKELSARTGISENTIKSYIKEQSAEPTLSKAVKIARALDVSIAFLAGEQERTAAASPSMLKLQSLTKDFTENEMSILLATAAAIKKNKETSRPER